MSASQAAVVAIIVASAVVVDPFGFQAFLLMRYAVALVALLAAFAVMWKQGIALPQQRAIRVAFPSLLLLLFISTLFARAPLVALLGASGRQLGWLAWVMFAVSFVAGLSLFDSSEHRRIETALIIGFSSAIIGVGAIGALELGGVPLVDVNQQFGSRLQASFGNPAVLGAFTVLGLPIVIAGFAARRFPVLTGVASAIGATMLVLSGARGAWVGFAVGAVFAAVALGRRGASAIVVRSVVIVAVVLLGATVLTGRWGTVLSGMEGRVATWQVAGEVVAGHPVVGVGPEGFATAFTEYVDDDYVIRYTRDDVIDRAHNGMLEVAVSAGLAGLAAYVTLVVMVLSIAWTAATKHGKARPVVVGAAAGVVAYLIQQQVFFQLAVLDLSFWLVVGLLVVLAGLGTDRRKMPIVVAVLFALVAATAVYAAVGVFADHEDKAALASVDAQEALVRLEHAASLRPSDDIHAIIAGGIAGEAGDVRSNASAGRLVDRALAVDPANGVLILERSALLVDAYELSGAVGALDEAQDDLERLVSRDGTNGEAFLRLGAIAFYKGERDIARRHWTRAALLMPHRREPVDNLRILGADG